MKFLALRDNAFFMRFCYERLHKHDLRVSATFVGLVAALVILGVNASVDDASEVSAFATRATAWFLVAQGVTLWLVGGFSILRFIRQERESGILDFHRASPTPFESQFVGLVLGAPILEYFSWALFFLLSCVFWTMSTIPAVWFLKFHIAFLSTAVFLHGFGVACALLINISAKTSLLRRVVVTYLLLHVFSGLFVGFSRAGSNHYSQSLFFHLTGLSLYAELISGVRHQFYPILANTVDFFHGVIPRVILQIFAQGVFAYFVFIAGVRTLRHPERPALSKLHYLTFCALLLFLALGLAFDQNTKWMELWVLIFALGIFGAFLNTPTEIQYLRGLRRMAKLKIPRPPFWSDTASNLSWVIGYSLLTTLAIFLLSTKGDRGLETSWLFRLLTMVSLIAWFSFLLEYFRLALGYLMKYFYLLIFFLWVFLPLAGYLGLKGWDAQNLLQIGFHAWFSPVNYFYPTPAAACVNLLVAIFTGFLAFQARRKFQSQAGIPAGIALGI